MVHGSFDSRNAIRKTESRSCAQDHTVPPVPKLHSNHEGFCRLALHSREH